MLTLMPPRQVIQLNDVLLQVIVFFLDYLLLHGNLRSKQPFLALVLKQNFELLPPLLLILFGCNGYWLILVYLVTLIHLFYVITWVLHKLLMIL
jgi:hypothetical protein